MRPTLKNFLLCSLLCSLALFNSGCLLKLLFAVITSDIGEFVEVAIKGESNIALCFQEEGEVPGSAFVHCTYAFADGELLQTSTVELLSKFGVFGVLVDPVILQVPQAVDNIAGTYDDGGGAGPQPLVISTMDSFLVQPGVNVTAEPGQKFVIIELPDGVAATLPGTNPQNGAPFNFAFSFSAPGVASMDVKAMLSGKVVINNQTFYVPLLPCVTDFSVVPAMTIPLSPGNVDLLTAIFSVLGQLIQQGTAGCNGQVYNFTPTSQLGPFMCYKTQSSKGNICGESSPANAGASCDDEEDCGGTPDETALCAPNKFPKNLQVALTDQFETDLLFDVKKPETLCNPATVGAISNQDADTHLEGYRTALSRTSPPQPKPARQTALRITNQLHPNGELVVDALKPNRLLAPTAKSLVGPVNEPDPATHEVDHFNCYNVKVSRGAPKFPKGLQTRLVDQFNQPKLYDIKKPTRLCAPADKNDGAPGAETHPDHLLCYQVKQVKGVCASDALANPGAACKKEEDCGGERRVTNFCKIQSKPRKVRDIFVNNQFGPEQLDVLKEDELCLPSTKARP